MRSRTASVHLIAGLLAGLVVELVLPTDASALVLCTKQKNGRSKSFFRTNDKCPRTFQLYSVPGDFLCWDRHDTGVRGVCDLTGPNKEDLNGDGECDADDCKASACWDLNGNQQADVDTEDFNGDGTVDLEDCRTFLDVATGSGATADHLAILRITRDSNLIFQQGGPDGSTLLVDVGRPWPVATTAEALLADPMDCGALQFARTIDAAGNLTCAPISDADIPDTITVNAANALKNDPMDCSASQFARTIDAAGNLTCAPITDADIPDTITATALTNDPMDCAAGLFATSIGTQADLGCTAITDADVPDTITVQRANALATDPAACAAGSFVTDVADTGALTCTPIGDITAAKADALSVDPTACPAGEFVRDIADTGTLDCDPLPVVPPTVPVSEDPDVTTTGEVAVDENGTPAGTPPQLVARAGSGAGTAPLVLDPRRETTVVLNAPAVGQSTVAFRAFEDATILSISCIADMLETGDTVGLTVRQLPPGGTDLDDVETISCDNESTDVVAPDVDAPDLAKGAWVTVRVDSVSGVDQVALSITWVPKQSIAP